MHQLHHSQNSSSLTKPAHWSRALLANSLFSKLTSTGASRFRSGLLAAGALAFGTSVNAQTTIFSENMGTPTATTAIATYATGTAPATFQNKGTLTYGNGAQASSADVRISSPSSNSGSSGGGNIFFSSTSGAYGFSIESIDASAFNTLQLSYNYRKDSNTLFATFSVDYWNGSAWVTVANTSANLFNETAATTGAWFAAKTLALPAGAQISGLKLRFVKTGTASLRIDDVRLTGTPAGGDVTAPTLTSSSPVSGATGVATNVTVIANFDEAVKAGSGVITLTNNATSATVPATVAFAGSSLTIQPTAVLALGTAYTVLIPNGAVLDLANNSYTGTTWTFTTDDTGPTLTTALVPANNATGIAPPTILTATFNEPVNLPITAGTSTITVKNAVGTPIVTFDSSVFDTGVAVSGSTLTLTIPPGTPLDFGSTYYVEIGAGAVTNDSGLPFVGYSGDAIWKFSTVDVPNLTTGAGYAQDFSTFVSMATLPLGWSLSGFTTTYLGTWAAGTGAGALGGETVFGYQHTSSTGTVLQTLTLRNATAETITDLVVSYNGRVARATETRIPIYTVRVGGNIITALAYSTADGDNITRTASLSGLTIAPGTTFQIEWSSDRGLSTGGARQIGISTASVAIGVAQFAPSVSDSVSLASVSYYGATLNGTIVSDGASVLTSRGFVYAATATNAAPAIGGTGVTTTIDDLVDNDPFSKVIVGLLPATGYTMRAYATNAIGTSYGAAVTFTTLATPPTFVTSYTQAFDAYNGSNPAGWSAVSSGGAQGYVGAWGNSAGAAGFTGGASAPGVLGYQHTSGTGTLTTELTLFNGTGSVLDNLTISYLGQASRTTEGRSPTFVVSVNGVEVPALAYSTLGNVNLTVTADLTSLGIATGAPFTITWVSDRGTGTGNAKQIGIGTVAVSLASANTYASWATANGVTGGFNGDSNSDGVPNGVAYFYGATGSAVVANPQLVNNKVTYPKDATATGATGVIQTSTDLVTWSPQTSNTSVPGFISYTLPTGQGKIFVRLSVTQVTP